MARVAGFVVCGEYFSRPRLDQLREDREKEVRANLALRTQKERQSRRAMSSASRSSTRRRTIESAGIGSMRKPAGSSDDLCRIPATGDLAHQGAPTRSKTDDYESQPGRLRSKQSTSVEREKRSISDASSSGGLPFPLKTQGQLRDSDSDSLRGREWSGSDPVIPSSPPAVPIATPSPRNSLSRSAPGVVEQRPTTTVTPSPMFYEEEMQWDQA